MKKEEEIKFCFIQSPFGVISGVAFREGEGIVASFKLEVKEDNIISEANPHNTMTGSQKSIKRNHFLATR